MNFIDEKIKNLNEQIEQNNTEVKKFKETIEKKTKTSLELLAKIYNLQKKYETNNQHIVVIERKIERTEGRTERLQEKKYDFITYKNQVNQRK